MCAQVSWSWSHGSVSYVCKYWKQEAFKTSESSLQPLALFKMWALGLDTSSYTYNVNTLLAEPSSWSLEPFSDSHVVFQGGREYAEAPHKLCLLFSLKLEEHLLGWTWGNDPEPEVEAKSGPSGRPRLGSADNGRREHYYFYWQVEWSGNDRSWWWEEQEGSVLVSERRYGWGRMGPRKRCELSQGPADIYHCGHWYGGCPPCERAVLPGWQWSLFSTGAQGPHEWSLPPK